MPSESMPSDTPIIRGHDFDRSTDANDVLQSMLTMGFQGTCLGQAIDEVNRMVRQGIGTTTVNIHTQPTARLAPF